MLGDVLDDEGEEAAAEIGDAARYVHLDVTDESSWEAASRPATARSTCSSTTPAILGPFTPIVKTSLDDFRRTLDVNLIGTFLGLKHGGAAIAPERRRGHRQHQLDQRAVGHAVRGVLRVVEVGGPRPHQDGGAGARPAEHPGELRAPRAASRRR